MGNFRLHCCFNFSHSVYIWARLAIQLPGQNFGTRYFLCFMLVWTNMKSKKFFDPINYHIITSTTIYNDHRFTTIYTHHSLFRAESYPNTYCIEYSKYMGILSPGLMTIPLNRNMNHCHRIYIYTYIYIYIHTWVLMKYNGNIHIYIYYGMFLLWLLIFP